MNLIKEYLGSIAGVHIFAIISMLIFIVTFLFMIIQTYSIKKENIRNTASYLWMKMRQIK